MREFQWISTLNIHWKDWCWSWSSNTLATWWEELTHCKRPWCWERLKAGGEGGDRGWDGWMASSAQWIWVWANSGRWWKTGKPGVLQQSMGSQRVEYNVVTEQQQQILKHVLANNKVYCLEFQEHYPRSDFQANLMTWICSRSSSDYSWVGHFVQNSELGRICSEVWELANDSGADDQETVIQEGLLGKGLSGKRKYEEKRWIQLLCTPWWHLRRGNERKKGSSMTPTFQMLKGRW